MKEHYKSSLTKALLLLLQIQLFVYTFFIPLYPKLPLRKIYNTYVAVRLDDIFVIGIYLVFLLYFLIKRPKFDKKLVFLFFAFWIGVFISFIIGRFVMGTIPPHLTFVAILNGLRRVQYMGIFFIAFTVIKNPSVFWLLFGATILNLFLVDIYALGQRFLSFPAYSTMNPEFAKGQRLILTPEARISSTFAGHYDLASYLVLFLPIIWGIYYGFKEKWYKIIAMLGYVLSLSVLFFTASRTSFIAYLVSTPLLLLYLKKFKTLTFVILTSVVLMLISPALLTRFLATFQIKQILVDPSTGKTIIVQNSTIKELPAGDTFLRTSGSSDTDASRSFKDRLAESEANKYDVPIASIEAELSKYQTQQVVATDISMSTRFKVEWPRAIKAWLKNPIFGSGPISITEATDNDYLRWLGEFGAYGFLTFMAIILLICKRIFDFTKQNSHHKYLFISILFGVWGLLVNALYIDVFEASKVAYHFWFLLGITTGYIAVMSKNNSTK